MLDTKELQRFYYGRPPLVIIDDREEKKLNYAKRVILKKIEKTHIVTNLKYKLSKTNLRRLLTCSKRYIQFTNVKRVKKKWCLRQDLYMYCERKGCSFRHKKLLKICYKGQRCVESSCEYLHPIEVD